MGRSRGMSLTRQVELRWHAIATHWQQHYPDLSSDVISDYTRQFLCDSAFAVGCWQVDHSRGWGLWQTTSCSGIQALSTPILTGIFQGTIAIDPVLETLEVPTDILDPWLSYLSTEPLSPEQLGQIYEAALHQSLQAGATGQGRKRQGSYFTPIDMADRMVRTTLTPVLQSAEGLPRLLDPACGGGIFLLRAYRELLRQRDRYPSLEPLTTAQLLEQCLFGIDLDAGALRVTHLAFLLQWLGQVRSAVDFEAPPQLGRNLHCGNALVEGGGERRQASGITKSKIPNLKSKARCGEGVCDGAQGIDCIGAFPEAMVPWDVSLTIASGGFDIVISNPPYLDAEWMSKTDPALRAYCTRHYESARGNWDLFCPFVERGLQLCRPGGWLAMVVPNKLASAVYAAPVRRLLTQAADLRALWDYAHTAAFTAAVYPLVFVAQARCLGAGGSSTQRLDSVQPVALSDGTLPYWHFQSSKGSANHPWPTRPDPDIHTLIYRWQQSLPSLGEQFQVTGAATVAEAYQLRSLLRETPQPKPGDLTFANSGTLDRYRLLWGLKRCRYLGQRYQYPVVPLAFHGQLSPRRLSQAQQPKIIVAGLSRYLEGVLDDQGTVLAGKSTCVILGGASLWALLGILNSALMRCYVSRALGGQHLQGGYLTIGPPLLRQLPLPVITPDNPLSQALSQQVQTRQALQHQLDRSTLPGDHPSARRPPVAGDFGRHTHETTGTVPLCQGTLAAQIQATEQAIDNLVYKLYGLNEQEIAWVQGQDVIKRSKES
ncbi:MAG: N-6 DNA methylase [Cyanobacteria bacterium J06635_15]